MKTIYSVNNLIEEVNKIIKKNKTIGFVPTMGALHKGHASLIKQARKENDTVILSIYPNPLQFLKGEDFKQYPKDPDTDKKIAETLKTDILFFPHDNEMYPESFSTYVHVDTLTDKLCARFRPGHFQGVTTVVTKLFNITKPHKAYFGEKDYQQLLVIKKMVKDLNFDIKIIGVPIVREKDGLAMSSRNNYLAPKERSAALSIYEAIQRAKEMAQTGEKICSKILNEANKIIENKSRGVTFSIDYIKICNFETLDDIEIIKDKALLAIAVKYKSARLIDNCILEIL